MFLLVGVFLFSGDYFECIGSIDLLKMVIYLCIMFNVLDN